jgi:hypothetical protein
MAKFLSADRTEIFKFEGFGHFGEEIAARARELGDRRLGAPHSPAAQGFGSYRIVAGSLMRPSEVSRELLRTAADYCAFRASNFASCGAAPSQLEEMARWNVHCEFGCELAPAQTKLRVEHPCVVDGRMLPREWMQITNGVTRFIKLDAVSHGDDHFFPGPCDIAWDLAGFISEWNLDREGAGFFLSCYRKASGDDAKPRLGAYLLAYAAFRLGWSRMAAQACAGQPDETLLQRDCERYRILVGDLLVEQRIHVPLSRRREIVCGNQALNPASS